MSSASNLNLRSVDHPTGSVRKRISAKFGSGKTAVDQLEGWFPGWTEIDLSSVAENSEIIGNPTGPVKSIVAANLLRHCHAAFDDRKLAALWQTMHFSRVGRSDFDPAESPVASAQTAEAHWVATILVDTEKGESKAVRHAGRALRQVLETHSDNDGTPHALLLADLADWLAVFARSTSWAHATGVRLWKAEDRLRFAGLVGFVAQLVRPDGMLPFGKSLDLRPLLRLAANVAGHDLSGKQRRLIKRLKTSIEPFDLFTTKSLGKGSKTTNASTQSDWAKVALLRSSWRPESDGVTLAWETAQPRIEARAGGQSFFEGDWTLGVKVDDSPVTFTADWDAVSWFSDDEADYLELQWPNDLGLTVCRQILFCRKTVQLLLADAISVPPGTAEKPASKISVETTLPLANESVEVQEFDEGEIRWQSSGASVRMFAPSLPIEPGQQDSYFRPLAKTTVLRQNGVGGVYSVIVCNWHPQRQDAFADWRRLTVTADRRVLSSGQAVGLRFRLGATQWLISRRLDGMKNRRAVLGHHHAEETVIGRVAGDGTIDPIVQVE